MNMNNIIKEIDVDKAINFYIKAKEVQKIRYNKYIKTEKGQEKAREANRRYYEKNKEDPEFKKLKALRSKQTRLKKFEKNSLEISN